MDVAGWVAINGEKEFCPGCYQGYYHSERFEFEISNLRADNVLI